MGLENKRYPALSWSQVPNWAHDKKHSSVSCLVIESKMVEVQIVRMEHMGKQIEEPFTETWRGWEKESRVKWTTFVLGFSDGVRSDGIKIRTKGRRDRSWIWRMFTCVYGTYSLVAGWRERENLGDTFELEMKIC